MPTNLENFLPEVLVEIPEVPDVLAIHHLRNAAISFCQRSTYVRSDLAFNTVVDQHTYTDLDYTLPAESRIVEIYDGVWGTNNAILRKTPGQLASLLGFDWETQTGNVNYSTRETADSLRLVKIPTSITAVTISAAYKPTQTAVSVDDSLYDDWHEVIARGALARIYAIPRKEWTDPNAAQGNASLFADGITQAKRRVENAFMKPTRTVRYGGI